MKATLEQRFWVRVDKTHGQGPNGDCWTWVGARTKFGYGKVKVAKRQTNAHRVAWVLANGLVNGQEDYSGICVLHHCDNPPCCNPDHLFLGTQLDNVADRDAKGRGRWVGSPGDKNGSRTCPEMVPRGDNHWARKNPEKLFAVNGHPSVLYPGIRKGERNGRSKVTSDTVRDIRKLSLSGVKTKTIAEMFGIGSTAIQKINARTTWADVT